MTSDSNYFEVPARLIKIIQSEPLKNVAFYFWLQLWIILTDFIVFLYHFDREEIIHATVLKFITSP